MAECRLYGSFSSRCARRRFATFKSQLKQMLNFSTIERNAIMFGSKLDSSRGKLVLNKQKSALFFHITFALLLTSIAPSIAHAVDAPRDARGTVVRSDVIKWEWSRVSDAVRYQVNVNGSFVALATDNNYYSRNLANGDYRMTVQAIDSSGRYSSPSEQSASRRIGSASNSNSANASSESSGGGGSSDLPAPRDPRGTVVRADAIKWEWADVNGAQQYEIYVNDNSIGLTNDRFVYSRGLSSGEYRMRVRAVDSNGNRSSDSDTARQSIAGGSNNTSGSSNSASANNASASNSNGGLPAPRDPRGTRVRAAEIKWEWASVSGANEYEVTVDGSTARTANTFYRSKNLSIGEHTMTVKAIGSNGAVSNASNQAKASTWENGSGGDSNNNNNNSQPAPQAQNAPTATASLSKPRDVRGTQVRPQEVKWEWSRVDGAARYEVYLDGASVGTTDDDQLYTKNLSSGEHTVTVAAIDSQGRYSESSNRAIAIVNGEAAQASNNNNDNSNNNDSSPLPPPPANDNGLIDPASWNYSEVSQKPGYQLVFSDEFNSGSLNRNRWNTQLRWDGSFNGDRYEYRVVNGEAQFYVNIFSPDQEHLDKVASVYNPFEFDGNRLAIRSKRNPLKDREFDKGYGPLSQVSRQQPFLSGVISTYDKFKQKYGYFEARIKIPNHLGTFPAFWLHHHKREWEGTQKTEIDIMENLGHAPWYVYNSFHYFTGVSEGVSGTPHFVKPKPQGQIYTGTDYSEDYHVYAAEWKPGHIRFLIDGQQVSEVWNSASDHEELYIIINMAVGGVWTNMATNAGGTGRNAEGNPFPSQQDINNWGNPALEIDYVRVYKAK